MKQIFLRHIHMTPFVHIPHLCFLSWLLSFIGFCFHLHSFVNVCWSTMFLEIFFQFAAVDMEETSIHITQPEIQIFPYDKNELNVSTIRNVWSKAASKDGLPDKFFIIRLLIFFDDFSIIVCFTFSLNQVAV